MADTAGTSTWSDIPLDLASRILALLPAHVDRVRFAAVCAQWRAATRHGPLPPPLPLLLLSDARMYSLPGNEPFHFSGCTGTGYTDACGDWLVFSGEDSCFLRDPFSNATMTLPPLSRVRVSRDGRAVWSEVVEPKKCTSDWKLWLCSPDFIVATLQLKGGKRMAMCQARATSWWSVCLDNRCGDFLDMAFHQGKLYALDLQDALFTINVSMDHRGDPWISQVRKVINNGPRRPMFHFLTVLTHKRTYLVESRGVLLRVLRKLRHPLIDLRALSGADAVAHCVFEVFKADLSQSKWFKVTTIGNNEVLFLRPRCSRSVCVSHNALPGDCIFFLNNDDKDCRLFGTSSCCSVYSMTDGKVSTPLPTVSWEPAMEFGTWLFPRS